MANIKLALRYLWGDEEGDKDLQEGNLPNSIRVAISSNSGALINGHFGLCIRFLVYQLSETEHCSCSCNPSAAPQRQK